MIAALLLALFAGLATSIGGVLALHKKVLDRRMLAVALAFAAGAMLFISFTQLLPFGVEALQVKFGDWGSQAVTYAAFFVGIILVVLIDRFLPKSLNPNEITGKDGYDTLSTKRANKKLLRSGILVAVVLALHNFPEGMSTFFVSYQDISVGLSLAVVIAIHNIPEGIAVAAPIYAATKSRKKAFWWATASGLTEPIGALVAFGLVSLFVPQELFGVIFGLIAGMMVFVAVDELLPAARRYQTDKHQVVYGLLAGMIVVIVTSLAM